MGGRAVTKAGDWDFVSGPRNLEGAEKLPVCLGSKVRRRKNGAGFMLLAPGAKIAWYGSVGGRISGSSQRGHVFPDLALGTHVIIVLF